MLFSREVAESSSLQTYIKHGIRLKSHADFFGSQKKFLVQLKVQFSSQSVNEGRSNFPGKISHSLVCKESSAESTWKNSDNWEERAKRSTIQLFTKFKA